MFTLKYTSTLLELQQYLDKRFEQYIEVKELEEEQAFLIKLHYEEERKIMTEQVYGSPDKLQEMCFMAFLGQLSKEKNLKVSNIVLQCPFLLYLLGVASFDVFEEGYGGIDYLTKRSRINTTEYYMDDQFYKSAKREMDAFFEQSGYVCVLIENEESDAAREMDSETIEILVVSCENEILEHKSELGVLYKGNNCIAEDRWFDLYSQGLTYVFRSMKQEQKELSEDVILAVQAYRNRQMDKATAIRIVASEMITYRCDWNSRYYRAMQRLDAHIYSREDLYKYLLAHQMKEDKAWYWTEMIRKGILKHRVNSYQISYQDYAQLYLAIGEEAIDLFCHVRYLPSCWSVLERFYRLMDQNI